MPDFPAMNIPVALMEEVKGIHQLIANAQWKGVIRWWMSQPLNGLIEYEWPEAETIRYFPFGKGNQSALRIVLRNVHIIEYGPIEWEEARQSGGEHKDFVNETNVRIPIDQGTYRDTFSATFSETKSLEDETKNGFISEAMAKLGGISSPVQASINQKVDLEFRKSFGTVTSEARTVSQEITLPTPLDITVRGIRERATEQRLTKSQPRFDYGIAFRGEYNDGGWWEVYFASKAEFVQFVRGQADDSVGVYRKGGGSVKDFFTPNRIPIPDGPSTPQAPKFRANPQPGASVPDLSPSLEWTASYDNVHRTGIEVIDHTKE